MLVASFTDAWIETINQNRFIVCISVASFTDAWIETINQNRFIVCISVASFTDAWIETFENPNSVYPILSHLLQMRGLKLRCL